MAQDEDSKNSEGVCEKIFDAICISPFRAKSHRISHQPNHSHYSISTTDVPKPNILDTNSSAKTSPLQTKPVHLVRQQTIPIESDPPVAYIPVRKIEKEVKKEDDESMHGRSDERESMFSEYISKVKQQMMKSESNVGGGGVGGGGTEDDDDDSGRIDKREDSFNDNVTDYITRAKMKIRTTTTVGNQKSYSFK